MSFVCVCVFLLICLSKETRPGVKFGFPKKTLDYMSAQIFPFVEKKLTGLKLPSFSERVGKRGHIEVDISNGNITQCQITNPTYKLISNDLIQVHLPDVHIEGSTYLHYSVKVVPHIHGHGTLTMDILADITVNFGAKIDDKHPSNIEIIASNCSLKWKEFHISDHGSLHRIYDKIIGHVTGSLENSIGGLVEKEVPEQAVGLLQPIIDSIPFEYHIGLRNLDFSYRLEEILFTPFEDYMMFGARGCLMDGTILPPGEAGGMPDFTFDRSNMIQTFFSEWAFTSSIWAAEHAGLLKYTIQDSKLLPIHLTTQSLGLFIPGLKEYGDKEMQILLYVKPLTTPSFKFSETKITLLGTMEALFQVKNSTTQIIDAFLLQNDVVMNATVELLKGREPFTTNIQYKVGLVLWLEYLNISLIYSKVGQFDPVILQKLFISVMDFFVLPMLNKWFLSGIPIPSSKFFEPIDPKIVMHEGYAEVTFNFNFFPPEF